VHLVCSSCQRPLGRTAIRRYEPVGRRGGRPAGLLSGRKVLPFVVSGKPGWVSG
jgi:hypothetical protein